MPSPDWDVIVRVRREQSHGCVELQRGLVPEGFWKNMIQLARLMARWR